MTLHDRLTPHFSKWEFVTSQTATRQGIDNSPSEKEWANLTALATEILEPARAALGPLRVTSGYRCPALNAAIGGAADSQHMRGEAADLIPHDVTLQTLFKWLYTFAPFDQLIWEFGSWVHVSHVKAGLRRGQALIAYKQNGGTVYVPFTADQMSNL